PEQDLHSGLYGGAARNPIMALSHILTSMKNEEEVVTIDGFYDNVDILTTEERTWLEKEKGEDNKKTTGVSATISEKGYHANEHTMGRLTLEINGIYGGYQGEGAKTIIPSTANAKITCRLVPDQDPKQLQELLKRHILKVKPTGVEV